MIAVDTNILVYSTRMESPWFATAEKVLTDLAEDPRGWAIPWPCIYEFLSVVTNPRIYRPATPLPEAFRQVADWLESPSLTLLSERPDHLSALRDVALPAAVVGGAIHDARIAALCVYHGVGTLYSADRDFSRFPRLSVRNPLV